MRLVEAAGIELLATLKTRKLLIPLNAKYAKNGEYARVRYTAGTQTGTNRAVDVKYGWEPRKTPSPSRPSSASLGPPSTHLATD